MKTRLFTTTENDIREAAKIISDGGLIAFPTETVYGLGANALDADAVASIYEAKGRPSDNPMIVHIASDKDMEALSPAMTEDMSKLMDAFWPGPLTMVVAKKDGVPDRTTGGLDTVAVRMPDSKIALDLIRESGCPIAAPSANISGRPSPTRAKDVIADMDGIIEGVICGEDCRVGIESTVLDVTGETPIILRPGIITADKIAFVLQKEVRYDEALLAGKNSGDIKPRSPGMKYKHYAPKAEMLIIEGHQQNVRQEIEKIKAEKEAQGLKVGVMMFEDDAFEEAARDFFAKLRDFDNEGADMILAGALCDSDGVGFAVMNRMLKSAGYNIIKV